MKAGFGGNKSDSLKSQMSASDKDEMGEGQGAMSSPKARKL